VDASRDTQYENSQRVIDLRPALARRVVRVSGGLLGCSKERFEVITQDQPAATDFGRLQPASADFLIEFGLADAGSNGGFLHLECDLVTVLCGFGHLALSSALRWQVVIAVFGGRQPRMVGNGR
jgi:hypothetical protein